ncbi:hypothetical protein I553_10661 [Mycobacterium xenopi 4042]|uniref:Uncharacterized protein n=1 Tax=Mycobacterium xenopi 4042 TaxID=1299334 RepID=X8DVD8_MYCXE|nr:hypothetical protein I553_10628 [Mycobacterium xenopi 4042]EUA72329.1 hypothetical protein I553_10661 [Mycobacterium xenopi 4042]
MRLRPGPRQEGRQGRQCGVRSSWDSSRILWKVDSKDHAVAALRPSPTR